ncbi:MAG TPA: efflux RND transporter periplasmic adaptor subunit [Gemmatimonas sp.]|nr:efflux RND transporter periplasmic adaptor subunit [Gemmatimonas sp.]
MKSRVHVYRGAALSAVLLAACTPAPAAEVSDKLVPVATALVTTDQVSDPVVATGTFGSRDDIPLAFKTGGVIARVLVDQGQTVRKGQTLAMLDTREIDALVTKATVAYEKASRDEARVGRLFTDSVATRTQWQDAGSARDAAAADLAAARVNRDYATIVAPQDGVILQRIAMAGSNIGAGSSVLILGGAARGRVLRAGLPDRDALRVKLGDAAVVRFDALPGKSFTAAVTLLAGSADPRTGTYTVEIALRGADGLPAGLVGRVEIATRSSGTATMVPVDALIEADADSAVAYTLEYTSTTDSTPVAKAHRVRISGVHGDRVAVTGISEGATVITRGAPYVSDGARVRVVANKP